MKVQCILDSAMIIDEVYECFKPSVLAALAPLAASFICPLTAGLSYLLMAYGEAYRTSHQDSRQAYHRCQPCTYFHKESIDE